MTTKNTKENTENDIENEIKKINNKDDNENFREKDSTDELYEEVNPESDEGEGEKNVSDTNENFQAEIESLRDEKLRLLAEMENLRKRADRERVDLIRYGSINLARDILSPDDNLTRALGAIMEDEKKWLEGREEQKKSKVGDWVLIGKVGINGSYQIIEIVDELYVCQQDDDGYKHTIKVTENEIIKL